jgi:tetratricopeptide (TPR) repeat protein
MILDSLGELHMVRGELDQAKDYLERAVGLATENGNKWYAAQALRTLGRCYLSVSDPENALAKAKEALNLAEIIGDRQAICESRLIAAEAHLVTRDFEECSQELQHVGAETTDSAT